MAPKPAAKKPDIPKKTSKPAAKQTKAAGKVAPVTPPAEPTDATKPKTPNWERIELDYRAGIKALRQIADEHGISEGAIRKRAKRDDWTRDLSERIQDKAEQLVRKEAVRNSVRKEATVTERVLVEANAQAVADIRLAHRKDIQRARKLTNSLLSELEQQTDPDTLIMLADLGEMLRKENDQGQDRLNDLYQKVISLAERSKTMKTLAESLQKVVDMERTAFGMDKEQEKTADPLATLLHSIANGSGNGFKPVADDPEHPTATKDGTNSFQPRQESGNGDQG
jgi:hypothetical protein